MFRCSLSTIHMLRSLRPATLALALVVGGCEGEDLGADSDDSNPEESVSNEVKAASIPKCPDALNTIRIYARAGTSPWSPLDNIVGGLSYLNVNRGMTVYLMARSEPDASRDQVPETGKWSWVGVFNGLKKKGASVELRNVLTKISPDNYGVYFDKKKPVRCRETHWVTLYHE